MHVFVIALTLLVICLLVLFRFRWRVRRRDVLKKYAEQHGGVVLGESGTIATSLFVETTSFADMDVPCVLIKDDDVLFDCGVRLLGGKVVIESRQSVFCQSMPELSGCEILFVLRRTPERFVASERFLVCNGDARTEKSVIVYSGVGCSCAQMAIKNVVEFCELENMNVHVSGGWVFVYRSSKVFDEQSLTHGFLLLHRVVPVLQLLGSCR